MERFGRAGLAFEHYRDVSRRESIRTYLDLPLVAGPKAPALLARLH